MLSVVFSLFGVLMFSLVSEVGWWVIACGVGVVSVLGLFVSCQSSLSFCLLMKDVSIDSMSWVFFQLTIIMIVFCLLVMGKNSVSEMGWCVWLSGFFLIFSFIVSDLLWFYWMFEGSVLPLLWMIIKCGYQPERLQAGKYFLLYTLASSLPFLGLIGWVHEGSGSLFMWGSFLKCGMVWWVLLFAPFLVKVPMYGVHSWLPKAHVEAPVVGSMLLAGLTLKLGGYGLIRMIEIFSVVGCGLLLGLSSALLWGAFITSVICLRQVDVKSLIAYSSVSHMALVIGGIFSGSLWGWCGAMSLMVAHAFSSSGLFFSAGVLYSRFSSRSFVVCKGMLSMAPFFSLWVFILLAANMAAPLTLNLCSEIMVMFSLVSQFFVFGVLVVIVSFFTAGYSLYFFGLVVHGNYSSGVGVWKGQSMCEMLVFFFHCVLVALCIFLLDLMCCWA